MSSSAFSQRLKELRMVRGLTKEEVCEDEAHLSVRQLTRLEAGKSQPTLATMEYLADRLQVGLAELTGKTESAQELTITMTCLKENNLSLISFTHECVLPLLVIKVMAKAYLKPRLMI